LLKDEPGEADGHGRNAGVILGGEHETLDGNVRGDGVQARILHAEVLEVLRAHVDEIGQSEILGGTLGHLHRNSLSRHFLSFFLFFSFSLFAQLILLPSELLSANVMVFLVL